MKHLTTPSTAKTPKKTAPPNPNLNKKEISLTEEEEQELAKKRAAEAEAELENTPNAALPEPVQVDTVTAEDLPSETLPTGALATSAVALNAIAFAVTNNIFDSSDEYSHTSASNRPYTSLEKPKPEEPKPEEPKPEELKPEELKPEELKPEELKPEELKPEELKPEEPKPEEPKPEEPKPEEPKPEEPKPEEPKPEEPKPEEPKPEEPKPEEPKPEEPKPEEPKPEEPKPEEPKPEEPKPEEPKPEEPKPEEPKPEEPKPEEPKPEEPKPEKPKPEKPKPEESKPEESKPIIPPVISIDKLTGDDVLSLNETKQSIRITGTVKHAHNGDKLQIMLGENTLEAVISDEKFAIHIEGEQLAKHQQIKAKVTTQNTAGEQTSAEIVHPYQVLPIYQTTIHYPDGAQSIQANETFNFGQLTYTIKDAQNAVMKDSTLSSTVITLLEEYLTQHPEIAEKNIEAAYKTDSDHDGIIDADDKDPTMWNVSERDLRFFATAAHSSENVNRNIFKNYKDKNIDDFNSQRMKDGADIREINHHWEVLRYVEDAGEGLGYVIYGNGKQADNHYDNVVVAFRGTNNSIDWVGNLELLSGDRHPQLNYIHQVADYVATYNPTHVYATGNSLGGYLAQYFAAYTMQTNPEWSKSLQHSSLFNPALLVTRNHSSEDLKQARAKTEEFLHTEIIDDSNNASPTALLKTNAYVIKGEWLSAGFTPLFDGLGTYDPTTFFDGTGSAVDKHKMDQFYAKNTALHNVFSTGYRFDKHYLNLDSDGDGLTNIQELRMGTSIQQADSDGDGFSDILEIKLGSPAQDPNGLPDFLNLIDVAKIFEPLSITVKSETLTGSEYKKEATVLLKPQLIEENIIYTLDETLAAENTSYFAV